MAGVASAGGGGRRSRRGFYYQDLYTLRCSLQALDGDWDEVRPEGDEDVTCIRHDPARLMYAQVKTKESSPQMWSEALLCEEDVHDHPETSILGRLFLGKQLPNQASFRLVTNLGVNVQLRPLLFGGPSGDPEPVRQRLDRALAALVPSDERSIRWCLERFTIEVSESTADGLEAIVTKEIERVSSALGQSLLTEERDLLFVSVMAEVQAAARDVTPHVLTREGVQELIIQAGDEARRTFDDRLALTTAGLSEKMEAAGFSQEQISGASETRFRFTRERRSAVGLRRQQLDLLSDEIAMACLQTHALRAVNEVAPGMPSFTDVSERVEELHERGVWLSRGVPLALAWGALHDITDRCRNTYV